MLTKEIIKKAIDKLPNSFSIDELIEKLIFIEKVEKGLQQSQTGNTLSNQDVKDLIAKWSS